MFREADSWIGAARAFRDERISRVLGNEPAIPNLKREASLFVHLLPLGRLDTLVRLRERLDHLRTAVPPLGDHQGCSYRFNADGYLLYYERTGVQCYTQWFRSGGLEGYDSFIVGERGAVTGQEFKEFFAEHVTDALRVFVAAAAHAISSLGIGPPYALMVSLFGIQQARIRYANGRLSEPIVPNQLILPPIVLEDDDAENLAALSDLLDIMWQAAGAVGLPV